MVEFRVVGVISYSVHHESHGLATVAKASAHVAGLAQRLLHDITNLNGVLIIPTCNRVEVLTDLAPSTSPDSLTKRVSEELGTLPTMRKGTDALIHLFAVAAGLDSMVVGEREISGQVRRAHTVALNEHTSSPTLTRSIEAALHTSRIIAQLTGLSSQGRSVVACGLDMCEDHMGPLATRRALLVGTGSYAGASVAALRARGVLDISVYSTSGRATRFARGHHVKPVEETDFISALASADVVVACRGLGSAVVRREHIEAAQDQCAHELTLLDLALTHDVEDGMSAIPGVHVIDLETVCRAVPAAQREQVSEAEDIIARGVEELVMELRARDMDPVVVALRRHIAQVVEEEIERLPHKDTLTHDDAAQAIRHVAARFAHSPTINARKAGRLGTGEEFIHALHQVTGMDCRSLVANGSLSASSSSTYSLPQEVSA